MTGLPVRNMTKTNGGATRLEIELIDPKLCDEFRTWCTGTFWFAFGKVNLNKQYSST